MGKESTVVLKNFQQQYLKIENNQDYIKKYTDDSFFYHLLNQALRRLNTPSDTFYIRQPFQDIFFEVIRQYVEQKNLDFRKKEQFSCYRACKISKDEYDDFSTNIGGFVQMEGFLSSSLEQDVGLRYFFEKK